jgi:hypothetical protein
MRFDTDSFLYHLQTSKFKYCRPRQNCYCARRTFLFDLCWEVLGETWLYNKTMDVSTNYARNNYLSTMEQSPPPFFKESEDSLPCSHYPKLDSNLKHVSPVHTPTFWCSQLYAFISRPMCYMTNPSHPNQFYNPNNICWGLYTMKFFVIWLPPLS